MRERDVLRGNPREERRHRPDAGAPASAERALREDALPASRRAVDDDWQAFATEDPAFFIKGSDTV